MIEYTSDKWGIWFAFRLRGSVFPKSFGFAIACSTLTVLGHLALTATDTRDAVKVGDQGTSMLSMFTFVLGFLIVFRTQQAYSRWWEGGTLLQELRGEWFNAYSCLVAFANPADSKKHEVMKFQHQLARLFSMLYGAGLAQVCSLDKKQFEVIDLEDFDLSALKFLDEAHDACEVSLQWIQRLIGEANSKETIKVAPPILSRVYNQLGNGIVKLNNARKIKHFPIPFPFAQMITFMLMIHWMVAAIICMTSIESPVWAGILAFTVIISFWSINFIALELEDPFGDDANDLPVHDMQVSLNKSLMELLKPRAMKAPDFNFNEAYHGQCKTYCADFVCMHEDIDRIAENRPKNAFAMAEATESQVSPRRISTQPVKIMVEEAQPLLPAPVPAPAAKPAAVPVPKKAAVPTVFVPPLRGSGEGGELSGGASLVRSPGVGQGGDESSAAGPARSSPEKSEEHCKTIEFQLGRVVSELENIADRQTVLYQLHCDFWGLLSVVFQRMPAVTAQVRPFYQAPFQPPDGAYQASPAVAPLKPSPLSVPLSRPSDGTGGSMPDGPSDLC